MDVIIYSFLIVSGLAGLSYYSIKKHFRRLLEEEQEKSFALRNTELHLASEKQKLESSLGEKERQIDEIRRQISAQTSNLSSEVIAKDKQIQSLTAQLQHETTVRSEMERQLSAIERQLTEFKTKAASEESRAAVLGSDVRTKEQTIDALSAEVRQLQQAGAAAHEQLSEQERGMDVLRSELNDQRAVNESLKSEIGRLQELNVRGNEQLRSLQNQLEQLQNELTAERSVNESLNDSRQSAESEFRSREEQLRQQLTDAELHLSSTSTELEKTAELLQEQTEIRTATEHALQESKQKLYTLIAELEEKIKGGEHAIAALQSELTQATGDLAAIEQSLRSLLQHSPLPNFVADENGLCESVNPALEELVGFGMDELSNKHFSRLFPADEREFYEEQWKQSVDRMEQFQGDTHIVAATGDTISASITFTEIRPDARTKKYVGSIVDRTVSIDAQRHHAAALQREQELLDLKSRFIAMVSNQLRTSLVTIAANAELLERFVDKWSDERRYHSFLRINESIRQMVDLVRDVTFTTKASTEEYTLTIAPVNLEAMFRDTAAELMTDLESRHHFILSEQGNITALPLDAALMKTITHQLLSNAFKYSRDSTEVKVHIEQQNSTCIISIADQGIGIPAAEQKHLFSSFFRASNVSNIFGTGLGLTIVQQCVRMHGGTVSVESQLNKGTTAVVTLPLKT